MKRKRKSEGPFVMIPLKILDAPAWRAMDPIARLLWIELCGTTALTMAKSTSLAGLPRK